MKHWIAPKGVCADRASAIDAFARQKSLCPLLTLVCLVQAEQQRAKDAGDSSEAEVWRHKLHHYLDQLFQKDQTAGADYHVLQVCLILVNTCLDTHLVSLCICDTRRHITRIEKDCYSCRLL